MQYNHGYVSTPGRHEGIDIAYQNGAAVYAVCDGEITNIVSGYEGSGGLSTIAIYYSKEDKTVIYLHSKPLSSINTGQYINQGQQIATQSWRGVSSSSSGHTHVEVRNGWATKARKSVDDPNLENDNPYPFWESVFWGNYHPSEEYSPGIYRVSTSSGSNLMLRDGPGTDGTNILERIPNSTELTVTDINGRWGTTTYNGKTGWIALWYCERIGDIPIQHYVFDLNGLLDGEVCGDLGAYGTADVYIDGKLVADDQNDYYNTNVPAGSYYEVTDVHWNSDVYDCKGLASGNWTGTVDGDVDVRLSFTTRSNLSVSAGTSVRATRFSWSPVKNAEYYHVKIWNGEHWVGDAFHIEWNLTGTSCEIALPAGYYEAYVDSQFSDTVTMSNVVPFTVIAEGTGMTTGGERVIPDGDYLIAATGYSDKSSYFYLDIEGAACPAANAANVLLTGPAQNLSEFDIWTLTYKDGFYTIAQKGTDMCLDVKDASTLEGGNVWVWEANESSAQKWVISLNGSDGYRVQSKCSGLSLDYCGGECINNTNIQQWRNNSSAAQSWMFIPYKPEQTLTEGRYVLLSSVNSVFEVDIPGETGDVENTANVQIWNSENSSSRYNSFDVKKLENGYYTLTHVASGKRFLLLEVLLHMVRTLGSMIQTGIRLMNGLSHEMETMEGMSLEQDAAVWQWIW